ncbi:MAG TPA: hypothetical protein VKM72_35625, partial [Thermoanaerobaculia bacterium]|nr:hypothetical protein [Thermoanaerobaculia bacterium]
MRSPLAMLALATLPIGLAFAQAPPPSAQTFSEEMEVREIGLVVELPESFSLLKQLTFDPGD